jgi:hypothetical protein
VGASAGREDRVRERFSEFVGGNGSNYQDVCLSNQQVQLHRVILNRLPRRKLSLWSERLFCIFQI